MWTFILWLGISALAYLLRPQPPQPKPASLSDFNFPTAQEGLPIPVTFGTVWIGGPNVVWYGDLHADPVTQSDGGLFGTGLGATEYTVGYRYSLGCHFVLCHGPCNTLNAIEVDERSAYGFPTAGGQILINKPDLFGGSSASGSSSGGEGGIQGFVSVKMGFPTESPNIYLVARLGIEVPAYRRVVSVILERLYIGTTPYLKPWRFQIGRSTVTSGGATIWYSGKATLLNGMNPAHIIYECLTDPEWGCGLPADLVDEANFEAVADVLYAEAFGLNLQWTQQEPLQAFIQRVLQHIDGRLAQDPGSGKFVLKLIRDDYLVANLPLFNETNVLEVDEYERRSWDELTNELIVQYENFATGKPKALTVQSIGGIQVLGGVVSQTIQYPGIRDDVLAARVGLRDLRLLSTPLARVRLNCNRSAYDLLPGDAFRLTWPALGLDQAVFRVARISYGSLTDGRVRIDASEDIFGSGTDSYVGGVGSEWVNSLLAPVAVTTEIAIEAPYWTIARGLAPADFAALGSTYGFAMLLAEQPQDFAYGFRLSSRLSPDDFVDRGERSFCPTATLVDAVDGVEASWTLAGDSLLDRVRVGSWAVIDGEVVGITAIDTDALTVDVERAVLDTCPISHASGARLWFAETPAIALDSTEWTDGDMIDLRAQTRTGIGILGIDAATNITATMDQRAERPYPPGKVTINTEAWPTSLLGDLVIAWAHRDRTQQLVSLVGQDAASIGPEAGTTYTIYIYDTSSGLKHTESGVSAATWTYTQSARESDFGGPGPHSVRIEIESARSSLASWQRQKRSFSVT